jgi:molybdenum cofactor guanylyltransferase
MNNKFVECSGHMVATILAGGRATRCGGLPKGNFICKDGNTIIQHLLDAIKTTGITNTTIVANDDAPYAKYGVPIIPDLWRDQGPLAGIISALKYFAQDDAASSLLILPCDLPNFTVTEIQKLTTAYHEAANKNALPAPLVFAATSSTEHHPLCAILSLHLLPKLEQIFMSGERKIRTVWQSVGAQAVLFTDEKAFVNMNRLSIGKR